MNSQLNYEYYEYAQFSYEYPHMIYLSPCDHAMQYMPVVEFHDYVPHTSQLI